VEINEQWKGFFNNQLKVSKLGLIIAVADFNLTKDGGRLGQ